MTLAGGSNAQFTTYFVTSPALTEYGEKGVSVIHPLALDFSGSAAAITLVGKALASGIEMEPKMAGSWTWVDDKHLEFAPKHDWPIDQEFKIKFTNKAIFARTVELQSYEFRFRTKAFTARIQDSSFYQDPQDPALKKLVATVQFSHPIDPANFEPRVSLEAARDAAYLGLKPKARGFTIVYDKFKLAAHIHSDPLTLPRDDSSIGIKVAKGLKAARGGNATTEPLSATVVIPGRASLRLSNLRMILAENGRYEPEQILMLTSSSPIAERALAGKITAYLLPERAPKQDKDDKEPHRWRDDEVGKDILASSQPVPLTYVPQEEGGDVNHGFKFRAPVGRYVYVVAAEGIEGIGGYVTGKPFIGVFNVEPFQQTLTFLGKGALLPLSGDKRVGFLVRDVDRVQIEIGRVLPNQVHHLAPNMWDFSKPYVYDEQADSIVERFTEVRNYSGKPPGKPTYDHRPRQVFA